MTTPTSPDTRALEDVRVELHNALVDMQAGWRYLRHHYGDLAGVGWDRCEQSSEAALNKSRSLITQPPALTDHAREVDAIERWRKRLDNPGSTWTHDRVAFELGKALSHIDQMIRILRSQAQAGQRTPGTVEVCANCHIEVSEPGFDCGDSGCPIRQEAK